MLTRILLLSALACAQALAQDAKPAMPTPQPALPECQIARTALYDANASKACEARMSAAAMPDPDKMLAAEPAAAGPRPPGRRQVIDEISRARQAGELDWAATETGLAPAPRLARR